MAINGYTLFFIRILRLRFGTMFFIKWGNIRPLQKKSMSNETASQEKQFKGVGGETSWAYMKVFTKLNQKLFTE